MGRVNSRDLRRAGLSLALAVLWAVVLVPWAAAAESAALTGVVQLVDLERLLIALTGQRGVAHALSLANREVARDIEKGDRVIVELDAEGLVRKITKAQVPTTGDVIPGP